MNIIIIYISYLICQDQKPLTTEPMYKSSLLERCCDIMRELRGTIPEEDILKASSC